MCWRMGTLEPTTCQAVHWVLGNIGSPAHQEPRLQRRKACRHAKMTNNTKQCRKVLGYMSDYTLLQKASMAPHYLQGNVPAPLLAIQSSGLHLELHLQPPGIPLTREHPLHPICFLPLYTLGFRLNKSTIFMLLCLCSSFCLFLECSPILSLNGEFLHTFQSPV